MPNPTFSKPKIYVIVNYFLQVILKNTIDIKGPCKKINLKPVYSYPPKNVLCDVERRVKCWYDTHCHCIYTKFFR